MPINNKHSSAGVYTATRDLSTGATALSTAVVAICGQARRGPINTRVRVTGQDELKNIFGAKDPKYGLGLYTAYPISAQTSELYYVRLVKNARYAVVVLSVDDPTALQPVLRLNNLTDDDGQILGVNDPSALGFVADDLLNENTLGYFICENPGAWNNNMALQIRPNNPKGLNAFDDRTRYNTKLFNVDIFENYVAGSVPKTIVACSLNNYTDDFNRQYEITQAISDDSSDIRFLKNPYFTQDIDFMTTDFVFMKGGSDGDKVTSDDLASAYTEYFSDPEEQRVTLMVSGGIEDYIIHRGMQQAASNHINCHVIASVPTTEQSVAKAIRYRRQTLNLSAANMSLYTPDYTTFDQDTGRYLSLPPAGQIAAVYCYTDNNRGTWFAPAGIAASSVLNITSLSQKYDQDARDALSRELVNYIRKLPAVLGGGFAVWEASTMLATSSAFQQIQIQRMVGYVLEVCQRSAKTGVFDPNDDILRTSLKVMVEKFLEEVKLGRGLRGGESGSTGYQVVCDSTNNTPATEANGDLLLDIVLDPTRHTKRIIYRFNINPAGSTATTLSGS